MCGARPNTRYSGPVLRELFGELSMSTRCFIARVGYAYSLDLVRWRSTHLDGLRAARVDDPTGRLPRGRDFTIIGNISLAKANLT